MSDAIRDTFLALMKQGMTPLEARREFEDELLHAAVRDEIMTFGPNPPTPSLLDLVGRSCMEKCNADAMEQAIELWMAGWKSEAQSKNSMVMSWYWRRPPRRKGSLGMRYLSTNQAFMAMKRQIPNLNP